MPTAETTQRRRQHRNRDDVRIIRLQVKDRTGNLRTITADLLNTARDGVGIALLTPLAVGSTVQVRGNLGENRTSAAVTATVKWCTQKINGNFHAGLELGGENTNAHAGQPERPQMLGEENDWYEVMQLSPNADTDTVSRVYRILAQRYHPDSPSGNQELFLRLCEAHRVLINPELRAQYDARHREAKKIHWEVFDRPELPTRQELEQRKRQAILEALYSKALLNPEQASMSLMDFESLLGVPREHLEAALWYLRGKGFVKRSDNARFSITITGFDAVEENSSPGGHDVKLIEASHSG